MQMEQIEARTFSGNRFCCQQLNLVGLMIQWWKESDIWDLFNSYSSQEESQWWEDGVLKESRSSSVLCHSELIWAHGNVG